MGEDYLKEDLRKFYPAELLNQLSITVIQSGDAILNTYDAHISSCKWCDYLSTIYTHQS